MKRLKKIKEETFMEFQKIDDVHQKLTWSNLARAIFFTTSFPLANQNSFTNLILIAKTSSLTRMIEVLEASGSV
jgi:hypothetical protein